MLKKIHTTIGIGGFIAILFVMALTVWLSPEGDHLISWAFG